jgi:hypothetical protein
MPIICRLFELTPDQATALSADPSGLVKSIASFKIYSDVYRYWHGIEYLLIQHRPSSQMARWLELGQALSNASEDMPAARLLLPQDVADLDALLRDIEPDDLIPHYEADALDGAGVYPRCWVDWEETFDPLGQMLEHYYFLQSFTKTCASAGDALLLYFEFLDDGSDDDSDD